MAISVAQIVLVHVDSITGEVFTKDASKMNKFRTNLQTPIERPREFSTEHRIMPDGVNANTANYPTIPAYLILEDSAGRKLVHMDQTYIVTQS